MAHRVQVGKRVGWPNGKGYLCTRIKQKAYRVHRIIYKMHNPDFDESLQVDHIDGDITNNNIENLRAVTGSQNQKNMKNRLDNSTGVPGVTKTKSGWFVKVGHEGQSIYLGHFKTFDEAVAARKAAEKIYNFSPNHGRQ